MRCINLALLVSLVVANPALSQSVSPRHVDNSKALISGETTNPEDKRRGGGHAHSGLSIYLADQWPESYRGKLLTLNFHGRVT